MGNKTGTDKDVYSISDCEHFAPGKTPLILKVNFSGIQVGDRWNDTYKLPMNGTFHLPNSGACSWTKGFDWGYITFQAGPTFSIAKIYVAGYPQNIYAEDIYTSTRWGNTNRYWGPGGHFYWGGGCQAAFIAPVPGPSAARMLASLGMDRGPRMFLEHFPEENKLATFRFAHKEIGTNIRIKFDPDAF